MPFDPFAVAALLISIVSLGFSIESRWRDRHDLRCAAHMSTSFGSGQETYEIAVEVTNLGRRPVSVVEVGYKDNEEDLGEGMLAISCPIHGGIVKREGPVELAENQTHAFSTGKLSRDALLKRTRRIDVVVRDSTGLRHFVTIDNDAYMGCEIEALAADFEAEEL